MAGYSATKAEVIGLVKELGKEFATNGIKVNGLAPVVIKTVMNKLLFSIKNDAFNKNFPAKSYSCNFAAKYNMSWQMERLF